MPIFTTTGPIDVAIKVPSGSVDVIASDRPDAVVTVKPANPGRDQDVRAARLGAARAETNAISPACRRAKQVRETSMTRELFWLTLTVILTGLL